MTVVCLMPDRRHVSIAGPTWSELISVDDLPKRLQFYRGLWGRGAAKPGEPGPYAHFYADAVQGLERVKREIARGVAA